MSSEPADHFDLTRICTKPAHCPICWQPNGCRIETGEPYRGPCWCEGPTLSSTALHRLLADAPEQRCVCRNCLEGIAANSDVTWDELVARNKPTTAPATPPPMEGDFYMEGENLVFTASYHLRRGACCGSGCRHCPFSGVAGETCASVPPRNDSAPAGSTFAFPNPQLGMRGIVGEI